MAPLPLLSKSQYAIGNEAVLVQIDNEARGIEGRGARRARGVGVIPNRDCGQQCLHLRLCGKQATYP